MKKKIRLKTPQKISTNGQLTCRGHNISQTEQIWKVELYFLTVFFLLKFCGLNNVPCKKVIEDPNVRIEYAQNTMCKVKDLKILQCKNFKTYKQKKKKTL